ncbi:hypothetical protein D3C80_1832530 [compost metagenome]
MEWLNYSSTPSKQSHYPFAFFSDRLEVTLLGTASESALYIGFYRLLHEPAPFEHAHFC